MSACGQRPSHRADIIPSAPSPGAVVCRSAIQSLPDYHGYRETLRWDFYFSCAYCTIAELEASGIRFNIDHYLPRSRYPELSAEYSNLMWSCDHCNEFKSDGPSKAAAEKGFRIFRPDFDDPDEHFEPNALSQLLWKGRTEKVGAFTVELLNLNRHSLRRLREVRARLEWSTREVHQGLRSLRRMSIEQLPTSRRVQFIEIRDRLLRAGELAETLTLERLLREISRSQLIDPPPTAGHDAKLRRQYLARVNAAIPDSRAR